MRSIKQISVNCCPYYFLSEMNNIKHFDPNLLNIGKISKILMLSSTTLDT